MATKRKALSKKTRFEVFKRDLFTCQYCGKKAPDVILEVDHIHPVANGGDNSIENLATSCFACNRGKRDKKLSDGSVVEKSRKQLELNQEKINQIDMIFKWKQSMESTNDYMVDKLEKLLNDKTGRKDISFKPELRIEMQKSIKKFGFDIMVGSAILAIEYYYKDEGSLDKAICKIIGIANNKYDETHNPDKASLRKVYYEARKLFYNLTPRKFYSSLIANNYNPLFEDKIIGTMNDCYNGLSFAEFDLFVCELIQRNS